MKTSYESKRLAAQAKADSSGRSTCVFETAWGYRVGFLTWSNVGSAQEVFEPAVAQ